MADSQSESPAGVLAREDEPLANADAIVLDHSPPEGPSSELWRLASAVANPPIGDLTAVQPRTLEAAAGRPLWEMPVAPGLPHLRTLLWQGAFYVVLFATAVGVAELICWYVAQ